MFYVEVILSGTTLIRVGINSSDYPKSHTSLSELSKSMDSNENAHLPAFMQAVGLVVASQTRAGPSPGAEPARDAALEAAKSGNKMLMWNMPKYLQRLVKIRNKSRQEYYRSYREVKKVEYEILKEVVKELKTKRKFSGDSGFGVLKDLMRELIEDNFMNRIHMKATNSRHYKTHYKGVKRAIIKLIQVCKDFGIQLDDMRG